MFKFGTVVLVPFPFTDLTSSKLRPALIISSDKINKNADDITVCFISSKTKHQRYGYNFILKDDVKNFNLSGLKVDSIFYFNKIATLHKKLIVGELGYIHISILKDMKKHFNNTFGF